MSHSKPNLTAAERLILLNQYRILEKLEPDDPDHAERAEALQSGFTVFYWPDWVHEDEVSEQDCREVFDVLDMHRALATAARNDTSIKPDDVKFRGFDGNNESKHHSFVCYLVEQLGRYAELKGVELNSHAPMLQRYRQMVDRWNDLGSNRHRLTADDVKRILA